MLKKLQLKSGLNRENTRYTSENGWYVCDKIRFRQGTPEVIGGWARLSGTAFLGVCRALFSWVTLAGYELLAVGTHLKYYVFFSGTFTDVTPLRDTVVLANPFTTTNASTTVLVTDATHGASTGDYVTFSGAAAVGGLTLNAEYQVTVLTANTYNITAASAATSSAVGGGAAVTAAYQIVTGPATQGTSYGWGAGGWGTGTWGVGTGEEAELRIWSQANFGEDLIFGPRYGGLYYWTAGAGAPSGRAVALSSLGGASDVPTLQHRIMVSDVSRFVFALGCNDLGSAVIDPMLIRWSDQENAAQWTPAITNQAGGLRLSKGSEISTGLQVRQEILVWTDVALYSLQYVGAPVVWGSTLLADGISCVSPNGVATAAGVTYWMGRDKFYKYDGRVDTQNCDLRSYVFGDINLAQPYQIFAGTNEAFNEVWWFYCSAGSTAVDKYVIYNYLEKVWYYGTMERTAWLDAGLISTPQAAAGQYLVAHEVGHDDASGVTSLPIHAYIESAEFDIEDGDQFGFVKRILPDLDFKDSTAVSPTVTVTLIPMKNSGSGAGTSIGGSDNAPVVRTAVADIDQFTGQVFVRVRGRQMIMRIESNQLGTTWQAGAFRLDIQPDGRRG